MLVKKHENALFTFSIIFQNWDGTGSWNPSLLTHWGRVMHICVSKLTIIGSDIGLSPGRRQAIIWTNAGILLIGPLAINFSEILIEIQIFSSKKMYLKLSSAKWHRLCLGLNVLRTRNCLTSLSVPWLLMNWWHQSQGNTSHLIDSFVVPECSSSRYTRV